MTLAFPKPSRLKSPAYLAWIRTQPCIGCGSAAQAHHTITRGAGGSDYRALPLCWRCHNAVHRMGRIKFEYKHLVNFAEEQVRLLETYLAAVELSS